MFSSVTAVLLAVLVFLVTKWIWYDSFTLVCEICGGDSNIEEQIENILPFRKRKAQFKVFESRGIPGPKPSLFNGNLSQMKKLVCCIYSASFYSCNFVTAFVFGEWQNMQEIRWMPEKQKENRQLGFLPINSIKDRNKDPRACAAVHAQHQKQLLAPKEVSVWAHFSLVAMRAFQLPLPNGFSFLRHRDCIHG